MRKYIIIYISSIFLFGLTYWLSFIFNPDSFIFHEQTNLHPFSSDIILGEEMNSLAFYQKKMDSLRVQNESLKKSLLEYIQLTDSITPISKEAYRKHEKAQWKNIEEWKSKQIPDSIKEKLKSIKHKIKILEENKGECELEIANLKIEQARLDYRLAEIEVILCDSVLRNLTLFQNDSLVSNFLHLDSMVVKYKFDSIPHLNVEIRKCEYQIENLRFDALNNFTKRISILDFFLFSASNSTAITYGDIIPNSIFVKIILFTQALFCIVLLGMLIAKIKE